jgi:hypothetical protein
MKYRSPLPSRDVSDLRWLQLPDSATNPTRPHLARSRIRWHRGSFQHFGENPVNSERKRTFSLILAIPRCCETPTANLERMRGGNSEPIKGGSTDTASLGVPHIAERYWYRRIPTMMMTPKRTGTIQSLFLFVDRLTRGTAGSDFGSRFEYWGSIRVSPYSVSRLTNLDRSGR